jgi:hypothetical protein
MTTRQTDTQAWWAEVQHLREPAQRRRQTAERRFARTEAGADRGPQGPLVDDALEALSSEVPGSRRTVQIRGQVIPNVPARRLVEVQRRRAGRARGPVDRMVARPDRIALWAVLFGLVLVVVAATSAHAAVL